MGPQPKGKWGQEKILAFGDFFSIFVLILEKR